MGFKVASRVRGLSDEAFREAFGTEEQCRTALVRLRWPDGFVCPLLAPSGDCVLAGRGLYQCNRCKKQTSPTAGTIFHATKLPLTLWFAAIHLIVTAKNGISSVELGAVSGQAADGLDREAQDHGVMARREGRHGLRGGWRWTMPISAECAPAASGAAARRARRPSWRRSRPVRGAPGQAEAGAGQGLPQARDRARRQALAGPRSGGCDGRPGLLGRTRRSRLQPSSDPHRVGPTGGRMASFKWVNTTLGNIKSAITGTYRKLGPDHAGRYLASFAWRYNRRYQLETMIPRFVHSAARTEPMPYRLLIAG